MALLLFSCGTKSETNQATPEKATTEVLVVFDIPQLLGKNIDEVRSLLGKPIDEEIEPSKIQMDMEFDSWDNSFEKSGKTLTVTFNPKTRKVLDFFIGTDDPSGLTSDYTDLIKMGNMYGNADKFSIEPVIALRDRTKFTGIKIINE